MTNIERSIEIAAAPEDVFRELTDLHRLTRWSTITDSHEGPDGQLHLGQEFNQSIYEPSEWSPRTPPSTLWTSSSKRRQPASSSIASCHVEPASAPRTARTWQDARHGAHRPGRRRRREDRRRGSPVGAINLDVRGSAPASPRSAYWLPSGTPGLRWSVAGEREIAATATAAHDSEPDALRGRRVGTTRRSRAHRRCSSSRSATRGRCTSTAASGWALKPKSRAGTSTAASRRSN